VQDAVGVDGEQIDDLSEACRDLAADDEQRFPEDRWLSLDEFFKPGLGGHASRKKPDWLVVYAPQAHFHRHRDPSTCTIPRQTILRTRRERISES
jgi:hypothetical protein